MSSKSVLILGSAGMLGIEVLKEFVSKSDISLYATYRKKKDLRKIKKIIGEKFQNIKWYKFEIFKDFEKKLKKIIRNKSYIINCIGVIKPYINETDQYSIQNAININSIFPHFLSRNCSKNTKIFQIATDCVYDGKKGNYSELDSHNAIDIYGRSKSLGEVNNKNFYNLRCSIVGKEIKNFNSLIDWLLSNKKNSSINGFENHLWNGVTTKYFARIISVLTQSNINIPNLIHIVPKDKITKYELLRLLRIKYRRKDLIITRLKTKTKVDRSLSTIHKNYVLKLNKLIGLKKIPNVSEIIMNFL
jgi:dTDP-4-dehydrorhamnose reductase